MRECLGAAPAGGAPVSPDKLLGQVYGEVPVEVVGRGGGRKKKQKKTHV